MERHVRHLLACLLVCLAPLCSLADIDDREYEFKKSVRSAAERKRLEHEFKSAQQAEAESERQAAEQEARLIAAAKAAYDALPYPLRLTQVRCTTCHTEDNYINQRHNRVGWELVILRMQLLNEAVLAAGERGLIADHLAQTRPATGHDALLESLQQLVTLLLPVGLWLGWKFARARLGGQRR
jgi:multidrug efflux pump subunit AcrA (membrane-fusion protein)